MPEPSDALAAGFPAPDLDPVHDPGHEAAARRAAPAEGAAARPLAVATAEVRLGTASWTDPTHTATTLFYPPGAGSPEGRLRHYATRFPMVEVDATYYAIPAARTAELWARRTPPDFVFHVKAHALMTGQPTETSRLPKALQQALPESLRGKPRLYGHELPAELYEQVWANFMAALGPLADAGKLGGVLMQYPRWFGPTAANVDAMLDGQRRLRDASMSGPVELRHAGWFGDARRKTERTLRFLADHRVPYVMVDGPQGLGSSVPPVAAVTDPALAIVRLHGRRTATWEGNRGATVERYRWFYDRAQLAEWVPRVAELAKQARQVHLVFNNCHGNYGTANAEEMGAMLQAMDDGR